MDTQSATASPAGVIARLRGLLGGSSEASVTRRLAGTIFIIRVFSAALAYFAQILLARWMGGSDYGIYVYVWTWVLLLGSMMDFGISASAQKIIPEYRTSGEHALLRGFLSGSRWITFAVSSIVSLLLAGVVKGLSPWIDANAIVPLYIGCLTLPAFVVANTQDGIARSHDWMRLGLMPQFIVRQSLIVGLTAGAFVLGFNLGATAAMWASAAAVWIAMIGQMIVLNRRLSGHIEPGPKAYDFRGWLAVSLPILMVEGFYLLLSYTDVLVLQQFRSSEEVGVYFAVVKTLALVSFIHYAMAARRQAAAVGLCSARDPVDVLAVAGRDHFAAGAGQAAAVAVRAAIRGRLRHHVHCRYWPRGALRHRPGRAVAQHARPPAHLRAGLCAHLRHEPRAVRDAGAPLRRPWRGGRDLDLAGVRDGAAVLDRAPEARTARARVRQALIPEINRTANAPHRACLFRAGMDGHRRPATAAFETSERHHRRIGEDIRRFRRAHKTFRAIRTPKPALLYSRWN
jgi:Polysaccharide biosynthesis protein